MTLRSAVFAATMVALPLAAHAQPIDGLYIGAGVGANFLQSQSIKSVGGIATNGLNLTSNVGVAALGNIGWGFGNGLRAELEFNYRYNSYRNVNAFGAAVNVSGKEQKYGPMVNVLYDFNDLSPAVVPYVGAGVGYQAINESFNNGGGSQTKGTFAYQGILGAAFPISPGLAVTAEYRFLGTTSNRNYNGVTVGNDYNHSIMLGMRYAFGAPAPAPMVTAPPAPAPSRSYLVFFDWDKSNLTARARGIIADAAANSAKVSYTKIDVNGYTDTSGTPRYNQGLSMRRAQTVAAELVKDGVPKTAIAISAFGETHLLVPTGPGVREPQNRRVEIIIR